MFIIKILNKISYGFTPNIIVDLLRRTGKEIDFLTIRFLIKNAINFANINYKYYYDRKY